MMGVACTEQQGRSIHLAGNMANCAPRRATASNAWPAVAEFKTYNVCGHGLILIN